MAKKKVYISGPITGIPNNNINEFSRMASLLQGLGHDPVNPHEILKFDDSLCWADYMRADIVALMDCDAYVLLDGWGDSRGARIEKRLADDLSIPNITADIIWDVASDLKRIAGADI